MCQLSLCGCVRNNNLARYKEEVAFAHEAASLTRTQALPWKGSAPLFGSRGGKLGMEIEVSLPTATYWEKTKSMALNLFTSKIIGAIETQLAAQGIEAHVEPNRCKCFIRSQDGSTSTLPLLITVTGIFDYKLFGEAQLAGVTNGLFQQLQEGGPPVPRDADDPDRSFKVAVDADGNPIKFLKDLLSEHPDLQGGIEEVRLERTFSYKGYAFSPKQFLLQIEVSKYDLITNKVGSSYIASLAGRAGAGKSVEIIETLYGQVAGQIVDQVASNGINILISGPTMASESFSDIGPLSLGASKALHDGGAWRSVIPLRYEELQKFNHSVSSVPQDVPVWKRTKMRGEKKTVAGFRLVMTVTGVNQNFAKKQLPALRNGVAQALAESLPQGLRDIGFNPSVNVKPCGFRPRLKEQPPFPHDQTGCADPPSN